MQVLDEERRQTVSHVGRVSQWPADSAGDAWTRRTTQLADFRRRCALLTDRDLRSAHALHRWSVENHRDFWRTLLDWSDLAWEGSADVVCTSDDVERATFFPDVRLNYAENLLRPLPGLDDEAVAVTAVHGDGRSEQLSRRRLRAMVHGTADRLTAEGVGTGDRVVLVAANNSHATVAVLAAAALGALVCTAMPDMGPTALLGRLQQVQPTVLVLDRTGYAGWTGHGGDTLSAVLDGLPTLRRVLVLDDGPLPGSASASVSHLDTHTEGGGGERAPWPRLPFDHPLFVVFSSGTTGPPKAIVHGAGGTLLEHAKEHRLHCDLCAGDTLYFHPTTAWMMWHWQLSALAVGAHIVIYDGPVDGPETLWELVSEHRVDVFGTSPAYLQLCQDEGYRPADGAGAARLRAILSTGAVLHDRQFDWVADAVGPQPVQSISGGTDILGCFVLGHPEQPVRRGRCQSLSLGLDVAALDEDGRPVLDQVGELVCRRPFPSRPLGFLADPDGRRFHEAYFAQHPGVWTHGDRIEIAADGSSRMHGRSDGVLNVDGVRIGPAEIYAAVSGIARVQQCMAVEQCDPTDPGRSRVVLLVVPRPGGVVDDELKQLIRSRVRQEASSAHVPSLVLGVPALPMTHSGKLSERAARDVLNGAPLVNLSALRNPDALEGIAAAVARAEAASPTAAAEPGADELHDLVAREFAAALAGPVGDTDDFFDAGGTSRGAIRLVRRLRSAVGADVPMADFLADPTVRGLTAALGAVTEERPALELLAPGDEALPPLYLVHGTFGDVDDYRHLVAGLDVTARVFGLCGRVVDPDRSSRSLQQLAAAHAQTLDGFQPSGPVRLAGHSFGGLLAFEIARELVARGRVVSFLGLIDVWPPAAGLTSWQRVVRRAAGFLAAAFHVERRTLTGLVLDRVRPQRATAYFEGEHGRAVTMYNDHRWGRYDGPVTFFRAARRVPVLTHQLYAWRRVVPDLSVIDTPGMHYDLMDGEHAGALGSRLSQALRDSAG